MKESKQQGELAELNFFTKAYGFGWVVSKPFGDNAKYDFIVDAGGKLSRVQVKSVTSVQKDSKSGKDSYRPLLCHGSKNKKKYTRHDIDMFAVFIVGLDVWYLIPINEVNKKRISVYPHRPLSRFSPRDSAKFEKFKSNWDMFL